jgi:hypothetical protein
MIGKMTEIILTTYKYLLIDKKDMTGKLWVIQGKDWGIAIRGHKSRDFTSVDGKTYHLKQDKGRPFSATPFNLFIKDEAM